MAHVKLLEDRSNVHRRRRGAAGLGGRLRERRARRTAIAGERAPAAMG
jgi:hypothetical protein